MIRGAHTPSLGSKQNPLEDAGIFFDYIFFLQIWATPSLSPKTSFQQQSLYHLDEAECHGAVTCFVFGLEKVRFGA